MTVHGPAQTYFSIYGQKRGAGRGPNGVEASNYRVQKHADEKGAGKARQTRKQSIRQAFPDGGEYRVFIIFTYMLNENGGVKGTVPLLMSWEIFPEFCVYVLRS